VVSSHVEIIDALAELAEAGQPLLQLLQNAVLRLTERLQEVDTVWAGFHGESKYGTNEEGMMLAEGLLIRFGETGGQLLVRLIIRALKAGVGELEAAIQPQQSLRRRPLLLTRLVRYQELNRARLVARCLVALTEFLDVSVDVTLNYPKRSRVEQSEHLAKGIARLEEFDGINTLGADLDAGKVLTNGIEVCGHAGGSWL